MQFNQIICGESAKVLSTFPANSVDLIVTDPPYLVGYRDRFGRTVANDDDPQAVSRSRRHRCLPWAEGAS